MFVILLAGSSSVPFAGESEAESPADALKNGKTEVNLHYRYENVSDDGTWGEGQPLRDGEASTLRTTLSYVTGRYRDLSAFVEFENVTDIGMGSDHANGGAGALDNGVVEHALIIDPQITEVNQAYLSISLIPETTVKIGRQEILLGNVRFVGNVGWRQNHQSFDAVSIVNTSIPGTTITYGYIVNVNNIKGANVDNDTHLLNAAVKITDSSKLILFGYLLDSDEVATLGLSTWGANFSSNYKVGERSNINWDLEYAIQSDAGDNPNTVDANYYRAEIGYGIDKLTFNAGHEVLEGAPGEGAFTTPLATLHKWNGWADKFLGTPSGGLEDTYLSVGLKVGKVKLTAVYHDFAANTGSVDYGTEWDLLAVMKTGWKQQFGLKASIYSADSWSNDTTKIWAWTAYTF